MWIRRHLPAPATGVLRGAFLVALTCLSLATAAHAAGTEDEAQMIVLDNRFGESTGATSIGDTFTDVRPGERFAYALQSNFESTGDSRYTTDTIVTFPAYVVPRVDLYPSGYSDFVTVEGNTVRIHQPGHGGISLRVPFDVADAFDLPDDATEIRFTVDITVVTAFSGTLHATVEEALPILRPSSFSAAVAAAPASVQASDPNAVVTVTVTLRNTGTDALTHVAPTADPVPSKLDAVEKLSGPTPASVDLSAGASKTITYTYKPKKAGSVAFAFASFAATGPRGSVHAGGVTTNTVAIKDDVTIAVTIEPGTLQADSSAASAGTVRLKVSDAQGDPVDGQRVALSFPQYFGIVDLNPRLLICRPDGTIAFPPGDDVTLLDAAYDVTPANGEVTYQLHLGTQRRSTQLLVSADAIDDDKSSVANDGKFVDLPASGSAPNPSSATDLNALQLGDLPEAQRTDGASVIGRGAPMEVLRALVAWLEAKREAGASPVKDVDWVPIASSDEQHAGVLIYPRERLNEVLAHFDGGPAVSDAYVLQIEAAPLGSFGQEVKWARRWMPLDTWENTPLDGQGLVLPPGSGDLRLRAKPMVSLVTDSPYAFLGYPYPTVGASADGGYGAGCLPTLSGIGVSIHSPVTLRVKDAQGRAFGFDATGAYTADIPGAVHVGGEPARYLLPPGRYEADVNGTGKGTATIVLTAPGAAPKTLLLKAKPGKTGTLTFDDGLANPTGTFAKRKAKIATGVPITISGVKKKVALRSGDPLTLTVTSVFGQSVPGARVHVTGKDVDIQSLTGAGGTASVPLVFPKTTKRIQIVVDGAGVQVKTLKVKLKRLK